MRLANWFSQGRGVVTACQLIEGDLTRSIMSPLLARPPHQMTMRCR